MFVVKKVPQETRFCGIFFDFKKVDAMAQNLRTVPFSFLFRLLLNTPRSLSVGLMLLILPLFALWMINTLAISEDGKGPDRWRIAETGRQVAAVVISRRSVSEITIEGRNPVEVTYLFEADGKEITDSVQTLDAPAYKLFKGEKLSVFFDGEDSFVPDFAPVHFPFWAFGALGVLSFMAASPLWPPRRFWAMPSGAPGGGGISTVTASCARPLWRVTARPMPSLLRHEGSG